MRKWFICPYCGQKLLQYDSVKASSEGVFLKCKKCKKEVEIKIATKSR